MNTKTKKAKLNARPVLLIHTLKQRRIRPSQTAYVRLGMNGMIIRKHVTNVRQALKRAGAQALARRVLKTHIHWHDPLSAQLAGQMKGLLQVLALLFLATATPDSALWTEHNAPFAAMAPFQAEGRRQQPTTPPSKGQHANSAP